MGVRFGSRYCELLRAGQGITMGDTSFWEMYYLDIKTPDIWNSNVPDADPEKWIRSITALLQTLLQTKTGSALFRSLKRMAQWIDVLPLNRLECNAHGGFPGTRVVDGRSYQGQLQFNPDVYMKRQPVLRAKAPLARQRSRSSLISRTDPCPPRRLMADPERRQTAGGPVRLSERGGVSGGRAHQYLYLRDQRPRFARRLLFLRRTQRAHSALRSAFSAAARRSSTSSSNSPGPGVPV